jgi:hypothetical protein
LALSRKRLGVDAGKTGCGAQGELMTLYTRRNILSAAAAALVGVVTRRAAGVAADPWLDRRSYGPFQCVSEFPLSTLDGFFHELSRLELELRRTLGVPPASSSVDIYLLADEAAHRRMLAEQFPKVPYRRALYVQRGGRGAVYAYRHAELPVDLRHECTHALLHTNLPMVPLWLDEGLAEYFEMPEGERAFDHPHLAKLRWELRLFRQLKVEFLEEQSELDDMGAAQYRYSWAWVHFMLHGPEAVHRALVSYLADIRRGDPPGRLSERLHAASPRLNERIVQHFEHWRRS